jgi:hypothetical protein
MNTDIRILMSFRGHRKRRRLQMLLGAEAVLCLIDLWIAAAVSRPRGILDGWDELDIAIEAGWQGDPAEFVNALVTSGFLDRQGDVYALHDWEENQPWAVGAEARSEKARRAAQARWGKAEQSQEDAGSKQPACPEHAPSMHQACDQHANRNAPLLSSPKKEEKYKEPPTCSPSPTVTPAAAPDGAEHAQEQDAFYLTRRKRKLRGQQLDAFNRFWRAFAYQKGKAAAADAWLDIPELTDSLVAQIVAAAEREATARPGLLTAGRTPKMAQGWISERRWEDGPSLLPMTRDGPPGDAQPRTYAQCQDAEQRMIARMIKPRDFDGNARRDPPGAGQGQPALRLEAGYGDAGTGRGGLGRDPG